MKKHKRFFRNLSKKKIKMSNPRSCKSFQLLKSILSPNEEKRGRAKLHKIYRITVCFFCFFCYQRERYLCLFLLTIDMGSTEAFDEGIFLARESLDQFCISISITKADFSGSQNTSFYHFMTLAITYNIILLLYL